MLSVKNKRGEETESKTLMTPSLRLSSLIPAAHALQSPIARYGLAIGSCVVTISIAALLTSYSIRLNLTILIILAIIIPAWYGGKGPGLLVGIVFEAVTLVATPTLAEASPAAYIFSHFSLTAFYVFVALLVSSRRDAEQQLRESGKDLLALIKASSQAVWRANETGQSEYIAEWWEALTGQKLDGTQNWLDVLHPEDRERVGEAWQRALKTKEVFDVEYRVKAKNGEYRHFAVRGVPVFREDGSFRRWFGTFTDITESKISEESLRESEARYRFLFDNNPFPMWVYDLETLRFLAVNYAATLHYGYSHEDFLSMTIRDIRPEEDIPALHEDLAKPNNRINSAKVWKHRKKDGSIIHVEISSHGLDFEGKQSRLVLSYDVTERKSLEEQLQQSQKLEAVGLLAGGIAHDFNNLLTAIIGYSELAITKLAPGSSPRRNVEEIRAAGERAASLTKQLLAFSRKQVLQTENIDLNKIVSEMQRMLRRLIGANIELRTALDAQLGSIKTDRGQMEQVVMNLVINARDAMPEGGKLSVETKNIYLDEDYAKHHVAVRPGFYAMLAVTDTGAGFDEEIRKRIFEPFFTTKEQGKGTGLGLSTVYGIVKQSGGDIWVYSEPQHGTTFKVYLPLADKPLQEVQSRIEAAKDLRGIETILLVEDEEVVRKLTHNALEMYGYHVLEAATSDEAVLLCERYGHPIDLLLTDIMMPKMNGKDLAKCFETRRPETKILYISGYTDDTVTQHDILEENLNFLEKPFSPDTLARKVREILESKNQ